jgi:hypothetical protein
MKLLVCIMTCHKLDYFIDDLTIDWCSQQGLRSLDQQARVNTIRATWLTELPEGFDYKFFYGTKLRDAKQNQRVPSKVTLRDPLSDEIFLDCGDGYTSNPYKMKEICRWALDHGYDCILRCDDDTFIYPERLLVNDSSEWTGKDYVGASDNNFHPGGCVFLSRRMMELVISERVTTYADDLWMGQIAKDYRIPMTTLRTMRNQWGTGYKVPASINPTGISSFHSCTPDVMRVLYAQSEVRSRRIDN